MYFTKLPATLKNEECFHNINDEAQTRIENFVKFICNVKKKARCYMLYNSLLYTVNTSTIFRPK